jgi:OmpA-OmpF porin, OOP family
MTYQAHPGQPALGYTNYDPAGQLTVGRYLSGAFDFRTHLTFSPKVRFPATESTTREAWLLDMSYNLVFKFYNGALLRESARIGPYLMVGLGGSYVQDNPDAYAPLGAGIRIRFNERMNLHLEAVRQLSLNRDYQHMSAAIAFVYNLNTEKKPEEPEPEPEEELLAEIAPDTDGDGVPDQDDDCPDTPGDANLLGCPPEDRIPGEESMAEETVEGDLNHGIVDDLGADPWGATEDASTYSDEEELTFPTETDGAGSLADQGGAYADADAAQGAPCVSLSEMDVEPVYFAYASDELSAETKRRLDRVADLMKTCNNVRLVLSGHTDDTGSERDNLTLSVMRAFRVKYYLVYTHGIRQARITSDGMGEAKPVAANVDEVLRQQNRRVDFELIF